MVWSSFSIPRYLLMVYHHRCSAIREMELELPLQLRSSLEVALSLERVINAAFEGEQPHARAVHHAFLASLTRSRLGDLKSNRSG